MAVARLEKFEKSFAMIWCVGEEAHVHEGERLDRERVVNRIQEIRRIVAGGEKPPEGDEFTVAQKIPRLGADGGDANLDLLHVRDRVRRRDGIKAELREIMG